MATGALANPVLAQGTCVVNCTADASFIGLRQNGRYTGHGQSVAFRIGGDSRAHYTIMPRELAVRLKGSCDFKLSLPHFNGAAGAMPRVFTSLNNFPVAQLSSPDGDAYKKLYDEGKTKNGVDQQIISRIMREIVAQNIVFMGIPLTKIDPDSNTSAHVAVNVAGTTSITNTGDKDIDIGQAVYWDVPDPFSPCPPPTRFITTGEPREKILVVTAGHPAQSDRHAYEVPSLTDLARTLRPETIAALRKTSLYTDYLKAFETTSERFRGIQQRKIGTALSKGTPGKIFDILVRS